MPASLLNKEETKMENWKQKRKRIFWVIFIFFCLIFFTFLISNVYAETVRGDTRTEEGLRKAISSWDFDMVNTSERQSMSWGCFLWCVDSLDPSRIIYAYTYGEASRDRAREKVVSALRTIGLCSRPGNLMTRSKRGK